MNATKMQSVLILVSGNRLLEERFGKFIVVLAKLVLSETELLVPMKIQVIKLWDFHCTGLIYK